MRQRGARQTTPGRLCVNVVFYCAAMGLVRGACADRLLGLNKHVLQQVTSTPLDDAACMEHDSLPFAFIRGDDFLSSTDPVDTAQNTVLRLRGGALNLFGLGEPKGTISVARENFAVPQHPALVTVSRRTQSLALSRLPRRGSLRAW